MRICLVSLVGMLLVTVTPMRAGATDDRPWTVYVANDNCPDYTWGLTEEQTRQAFADVVRGHLDEMKRTDGSAGRKPRPLQHGRHAGSDLFCREVPGAQAGTDRPDQGRTRVREPVPVQFAVGDAERGGRPADVLSGPATGTRVGHSADDGASHRGAVAALGHGDAAGRLRHPALDESLSTATTARSAISSARRCSIWKGPDGSRIKVWLDRFASSKSNYTQGAAVLRKPDSIEKEWIAHYAGLGAAYPLRSILASGTHGDISPRLGRTRPGSSPTRSFATTRGRATTRGWSMPPSRCSGRRSRRPKRSSRSCRSCAAASGTAGTSGRCRWRSTSPPCARASGGCWPRKRCWPSRAAGGAVRPRR